jgi:uncharacterized protein (TIGR02444 family)
MMNTPQSIPKGNLLWDFVSWAYAKPGIDKACIALQNRLGADVNMVLFCTWLAYRGTGTMHLAKYLDAALKMSREWQCKLVQPLRSCRESMKDIIEASYLVGIDRVAASALRERVKQCELDIEQLQNFALYSLVNDGSEDALARSPAEQKDDGHNNLRVYFAAAGIKLDPLGQTHVNKILTTIFCA